MRPRTREELDRVRAQKQAKIVTHLLGRSVVRGDEEDLASTLFSDPRDDTRSERSCRPGDDRLVLAGRDQPPEGIEVLYGV